MFSLSRVTRSALEAAMIRSLLRRHGVTVVSVTEPACPSPTERMIDSIVQLINAEFRKLHSEATRRGIEAARLRRQGQGS